MSIQNFLQQLLSDGQTTVDDQQEVLPEDLLACEKILTEFEKDYRLTFPGEAPEFDIDLALWAAKQFYHASQLTIYRDWGSEQFKKFFSDLFPEVEVISAQYSVDLTFRFLPDLYRFAQRSSSNDPLMDELNNWVIDWPLSSVGIKTDKTVSIRILSHHPGMMRFYVDRVIAKKDRSRAEDPLVQEMIIATIGLQDSLKRDLEMLLPLVPETAEESSEQL